VSNWYLLLVFSPQKTVKSAAPLARSKANPTIVMQLYQDYQNYQQNQHSF
jgi:hypothetical protein